MISQTIEERSGPRRARHDVCSSCRVLEWHVCYACGVCLGERPDEPLAAPRTVTPLPRGERMPLPSADALRNALLESACASLGSYIRDPADGSVYDRRTGSLVWARGDPLERNPGAVVAPADAEPVIYCTRHHCDWTARARCTCLTVVIPKPLPWPPPRYPGREPCCRHQSGGT